MCFGAAGGSGDGGTGVAGVVGIGGLAVGVVAVLCGAGWDMVASRVGLAWHGVVREGPGCVEKDAVGVGKVGGSKARWMEKLQSPDVKVRSKACSAVIIEVEW